MLLKLQLIGNLGKNAEVKDIGGNTVIDFSVAHTEKYTSQGAQKEKTTWVSCSYWTEKTAVAQYLNKGKMVFVEGTPSVDTYVNKDNQSVATLRLRISNLRLLGGRQEDAESQPMQSPTQTQQSNTSSSSSQEPTAENADDDLPF